MLECVVNYVRDLRDDANLKNIRFINTDELTVRKFVQVFSRNLLIKDAYD